MKPQNTVELFDVQSSSVWVPSLLSFKTISITTIFPVADQEISLVDVFSLSTAAGKASSLVVDDTLNVKIFHLVGAKVEWVSPSQRRWQRCQRAAHCPGPGLSTTGQLPADPVPCPYIVLFPAWLLHMALSENIGKVSKSVERNYLGRKRKQCPKISSSIFVYHQVSKPTNSERLVKQLYEN